MIDTASKKHNMLPNILQGFCILVFVVDVVLSIAAEGSIIESVNEYVDYNGSDLVEWIRSHPQGFIHPSVRIGRVRPDDPTSLIGLFVPNNAETIQEGSLIARIPWDLLIHPERHYRPDVYLSCESIEALITEMRLGERSSFAPYVAYLSSQSRGFLPGEWTPTGKSLLSLILGDDILPPYENEWLTRFETFWVDGCGGNINDPLEEAAFFLISSRDEDTLMVPVYDMANHSNDPRMLNTLSYKPREPGDTFRFAASRDILPGEEIFNSYNRCNRCSDFRNEFCETFSFIHTPGLFALFGFVEGFPQSWQFQTEEEDDEGRIFTFCLDEDVDSSALIVYWDEDELPGSDDVAFLWSQVDRLKALLGQKDEMELRLVHFEDGKIPPEKMTQQEWDTNWRYHHSLLRAISAAIVSLEHAGVTDGTRSVAEWVSKIGGDDDKL